MQRMTTFRLATTNVSRCAVIKTLFAFAICVSLALAPAAAFCLDMAGKRVNIIVPFKEGGGTDTYARMVQPFFSKYLPGNPTVIVRNEPGGGSVKAANKFQQQTKPDGFTVLAVSGSTLANFVMGGKKIKFNVLDWRPILLTPNGTLYYARKETGVTGKDVVADFKRLQSIDINYSADSPTTIQIGNIIGFEMLGLKNLNVIFGLSSGQRMQAILRGETQINSDSVNVFQKKMADYVTKGELIPLMTQGYGKTDGTIIRDPNYPDLPTTFEVYEKLYGKPPEGTVAEVYRNFTHMNVTAKKAFVLPPNTPDEIVDVWVEAARKVFADPQFQEKAVTIVGVYPVYYGKDAKELLRMATDMRPEARTWLRNYLKERFDVVVK